MLITIFTHIIAIVSIVSHSIEITTASAAATTKSKIEIHRTVFQTNVVRKIIASIAIAKAIAVELIIAIVVVAVSEWLIRLLWLEVSSEIIIVEWILASVASIEIFAIETIAIEVIAAEIAHAIELILRISIAAICTKKKGEDKIVCWIVYKLFSVVNIYFGSETLGCCHCRCRRAFVRSDDCYSICLASDHRRCHHHSRLNSAFDYSSVNATFVLCSVAALDRSWERFQCTCADGIDGEKNIEREIETKFTFDRDVLLYCLRKRI